MDFDYTWREPTEPQIAALEHAFHCVAGVDKDPPDRSLWHTIVAGEASRRAHMVDCDHFDYKLNPFDLAEMMLLADNSLWYTQAKMWRDDPPEKYGESYRRIAQLASSLVVAVVEQGYQDGKWWDLEILYPNAGLRALAIIGLLEFNRMTYELTHVCSAEEAMRVILTREGGGPVVSTGWRHLPLLLVPGLKVRKITRLLSGDEKSAALAMAEVRAHFDPEFRKAMRAAEREARAEVHKTYEPTECIHPECSNLVAPSRIRPREGHHKNYRGTGACRRGHNSYFCTKCNAPHSFVSKIGLKHYPEHYGKDWDGKDMEGRKWKRSRR